MSYEYTGRIVHIGEMETYGNFSKRVVVITDDHPDYPQAVPFEFVQKCVDKPLDYNEGDTVTVKFDLRGREHNGRYFGSNTGWHISGNQSEPQPVDNREETQAGVDEDEIPF